MQALLEFLSKVASLEKSNLMSLWNIATIMAPNLFLYQGNNCKGPEGGEKKLAEGVAGLVMAMVHYQDLLWTVSTLSKAGVCCHESLLLDYHHLQIIKECLLSY